MACKEDMFFNKDSEALEQVTLRSCGCPSLEMFKAKLDRALKVVPAHGERLD